MGDRIAGGKAEIERSHFPIVWLSEHGLLSDAQRVEVVEALDALLDGMSRHALVLDLTRGVPMPEDQRVYLADHWSMRADDIAQKWACIGVVLSEPVLSHLPTAAFWQRVSPVPTRVFTSLNDAIAWSRLSLERKRTGEIVAVPSKPTLRGVGR